MIFLNRTRELTALARFEHGLAVVWGRRRIGKTRLLTEWCAHAGGAYLVADQSSAELQRDYTARALAPTLPGFADVSYPDWERLLSRLAADARSNNFRGPIVFDELPYLVASEPALPSILQRWIDHEAKRAKLRVAIAGSSQRMMQGLVLSADAPLYGRASVLLDIKPLEPQYLRDALDVDGLDLLDQWTAWGGIPRYWELAATRSGPARSRLVALALDPAGPLFTEPDRLLMEESPMALEVRPLLDAIGNGANRLSEIAGRLGRPATSLTKPVDRLIGMGLIRREVPFGDPPRGGKRSLYRIDDPFLRAWFRVVAPNRAALTVGTAASRAAVLAPHWDHLRAEAWEEMARASVPTLRGALTKFGPWQPAQRYWHGNAPEWDIVAASFDGSRVLVADAWFTARPISKAAARRAATDLAARPLPPLSDGVDIVRALFVPVATRDVPGTLGGVHIVTVRDVLG
jgi:AAA+ ATPase superfamily predicted ATPase